MSKPLEEMSLTELRQYMFENRNKEQEWEKAYDLFRQKAEWKKVPTGASPEEQKRIIRDLIMRKTEK